MDIVLAEPNNSSTTNNNNDNNQHDNSNNSSNDESLAVTIHISMIMHIQVVEDGHEYKLAIDV